MAYKYCNVSYDTICKPQKTKGRTKEGYELLVHEQIKRIVNDIESIGAQKRLTKKEIKEIREKIFKKDEQLMLAKTKYNALLHNLKRTKKQDLEYLEMKSYVDGLTRSLGKWNTKLYHNSGAIRDEVKLIKSLLRMLRDPGNGWFYAFQRCYGYNQKQVRDRLLTKLSSKLVKPK